MYRRLVDDTLAPMIAHMPSSLDVLHNHLIFLHLVRTNN
jgi:hypothetical protein